MTIDIYTGLPSSGKSDALITRVNKARESGRTVNTFLCSDSPVLKARPGITQHRVFGSRSGVSASLDHFVSTVQCIKLLDQAPPDALLAFDEAHHFGDSVVEAWCSAAHRGVDIMIAAPSGSQLASLSLQGFEPTQMQLSCQVCARREATEFFLHLHEDRTESVCDSCYQSRKKQAESDIVDRLRRGAPYPEEKCLYQPVELSECADWRLLREDSHVRFDLIRDVCRSIGLPREHSSYLDIGCNTGFFCHRMSQLGFVSSGVDVTAADVEIARLLGSYIRHDYVNYVVADAHEYLAGTADTPVDVCSAFSVFQWVMMQKSPAHGLDCMRWLFQKTRLVCLLEMGESTEDHYIDRIGGMQYDSNWIYEFMKSEGGFARIDVLEKRRYPIWRDIFVGFKPECSEVKPMEGRWLPTKPWKKLARRLFRRLSS